MGSAAAEGMCCSIRVLPVKLLQYACVASCDPGHHMHRTIWGVTILE
jgi:hypothetical protein